MLFYLPIGIAMFVHRGCSGCPSRVFWLPIKVTLFSTESGHSTGSAGGASATMADKTWNVLNGLGSMAFAYSFSFVLVEIQVHLSSASWCSSFNCILVYIFQVHLSVHLSSW